jgi:fructoselysine-6-P-deglycase FrlB-like protein
MSDLDWQSDDYPELRDRPPWVMEEMMALQPQLAVELLDNRSPAMEQIASLIDATLRAGEPVTVCGCGSSEHAAHGIAALLASALPDRRRPLVQARPSLTAAIDPRAGLCLAVSHDGGTRATMLALEAARDAGARTAAITVDADSGVAQAADVIVHTPLHDRSWCHTVAYTSALLAGASLAACLGLDRVTAEHARAALQDNLTSRDGVKVAAALADRRVLICAGLGDDQITARELALKIAEGARIPTLALELETVLHGQLAGHDQVDGLILVAVSEHSQRDRIARRIQHVAQAAREIGLPVAALLTDEYAGGLAADLTPAGRARVQLPPSDLVQSTLGGLLAGAAALQRLTLELAHVRGTNPDLIRREQRPYRAAAHAAENPRDW